MKKKIVAFIVACAIVLSFTACGGNTETNKPETNSASKETETTVETPDVPLVNYDAWKDGKFTVNGFELTIGETKFGTADEGAKFDETRIYYNGYIRIREKITHGEKYEVGAHSDYIHEMNTYKSEADDTIVVKLASDNTIKFKNPYDKTIDRSECVLRYMETYYVYHIFENILSGESEHPFDDIVLPNDITYGASEQDIIDAYGEPSYIEDGVNVGGSQVKAYVYETDTIKLILWIKNDNLIGFKYLLIESDAYWTEYVNENPLQ